MKGIRLKGLFGRFDYEIPLIEGSTTILTGPNGFGKSTILQCIKAVADSDLLFFFELDFREFEILASDPKDNLLIVKADRGLRINEWNIKSRARLSLNKDLARKRRIFNSREDWEISGKEGDILDVMYWMA